MAAPKKSPKILAQTLRLVSKSVQKGYGFMFLLFWGNNNFWIAKAERTKPHSYSSIGDVSQWVFFWQQGENGKSASRARTQQISHKDERSIGELENVINSHRLFFMFVLEMSNKRRFRLLAYRQLI